MKKWLPLVALAGAQFITVLDQIGDERLGQSARRRLRHDRHEGHDRKGAYAIIGGVAGAGIAIGPILGGWATTELS
ncbi:MAG: hypothetical protein LH654_02655 [Thermoleophilia bacterium]|nr:hypothetical protein [Thermoleophilia bacterium]